MLRMTNLSLPLDYTQESMIKIAAARLKVDAKSIRNVHMIKRSVDARDKGDVHFVATIDVALINEDAVLKKQKGGAVVRAPKPETLSIPKAKLNKRPVVVGAGPSGMFAAWLLAKAGARPILLERGKCVEERTADVEQMRSNGILQTESNVQFGEGGAGTFSDGKLTTGIKSPYIRTVLETFVQHGAPDEILYLQKPHIGTDILKQVVSSIRNEIIALGGEVRFSTKLTGLTVHKGGIAAVTVERNGTTEEFSADSVILAIGHSARDTISALFRQGVRMEAKPFAMGVRIEHPQALINRSQYGRFASHPALKAADYKLAVHTPDGRGVYTFCMCPGGEVIAAASQENGLVVNGMSLHARAGENANAALLVGVHPEDFGDDHPLSGMEWQRSIEKAAFRAGGGGYRAPVQRVEDLLNDRETTRIGDVLPSYRPGVTCADLRACLPDFIVNDLKLGIRQMDHQLHGFAMPDALLTGVETRSSSPVRLPRNASRMTDEIDGLFPAGEGAGYAGGIVSAAVDGINAALAVLERGKCL